MTPQNQNRQDAIKFAHSMTDECPIPIINPIFNLCRQMLAEVERNKWLEGTNKILLQASDNHESELAAANEKIAKLEEALKFYTRPKNWRYYSPTKVRTPVESDMGKIARQALGIEDKK